jgi:hypothetical protein
VYGSAGNHPRTMGWRCDLDGVEHDRTSNGTRLNRGVNRRDAGSTKRAATRDGQEVLMDWGARYVHFRQTLAWRCRAKKADVGWWKEAVAPGCSCRRYHDAMAVSSLTFLVTGGSILTSLSFWYRPILPRLRGQPMPSREAAMTQVVSNLWSLMAL